LGDNLSPFFPSQAQAHITLTTTNKQTNKRRKIENLFAIRKGP